MRLKNSFFYTMREDSKDEESTSGRLLVRAGMIKKSSTGIYMMMPMGKRVISKIEGIIREEMDRTGAQELHMPALILEEVFESSGRRSAFGANMFALRDRYNKKYVLGPTHEELFAFAGMMHGKSYKDFPYNLYQFQTKYRDETRPRYGLIRTREFTMKDAYSYDISLDGLHTSYMKMFNAYKASFDRMKLDYKIVKADTGAMGGLLSEEFQAISAIGEDTIVLCNQCDYASNIEISEVVSAQVDQQEMKEKELVETPNAKTIEEVAAFFNENPKQFVKTLIYQINGQLYAFLVRGNRDLNETKVSKLLQVNEDDIELASFDAVEKLTHAKVGFAGPIDLQATIIMDKEIESMRNFIVGANQTDYHYKNVNLHDFTVNQVADIVNVQEGDTCSKCGGQIYFNKGIEIGNTFKLGTKYAESMDFYYLDQNNQLNPVVMGSYGIGVERCMAAIVEQNNDENGIAWPMSVAPYQVSLVLINLKDEIQVNLAESLYSKLQELGVEVIFDDRDERPGVKFKDAELIGIPLRIAVGKKAGEGIVEFKERHLDKVEVTVEQAITMVMDQIKQG